MKLCLLVFLIVETAFASLHAVKSNGVIQSWGLNTFGQLGQGTTKQVIGETNTVVFYPTFVNTSFTIESICPCYGSLKTYSKIFVTTTGEFIRVSILHLLTTRLQSAGGANLVVYETPVKLNYTLYGGATRVSQTVCFNTNVYALDDLGTLYTWYIL
jgi:hypothetical protein